MNSFLAKMAFQFCTFETSSQRSGPARVALWLTRHPFCKLFGGCLPSVPWLRRALWAYRTPPLASRCVGAAGPSWGLAAPAFSAAQELADSYLVITCRRGLFNRHVPLPVPCRMVKRAGHVRTSVADFPFVNWENKALSYALSNQPGWGLAFE